MKFFKLFGMLMISATLMLTSCGKDENNGTCSDGIKNQDETDIDCGGACQACIVGLQGKWKSYPVAEAGSGCVSAAQAVARAHRCGP